jgi:hypothetical protein
MSLALRVFWKVKIGWRLEYTGFLPPLCIILQPTSSIFACGRVAFVWLRNKSPIRPDLTQETTLCHFMTAKICLRGFLPPNYCIICYRSTPDRCVITPRKRTVPFIELRATRTNATRTAATRNGPGTETHQRRDRRLPARSSSPSVGHAARRRAASSAPVPPPPLSAAPPWPPPP